MAASPCGATGLGHSYRNHSGLRRRRRRLEGGVASQDDHCPRTPDPGTRDALATLADAVAKEVNVRREVEAERASLRTTLLVIVISVIGLSVLFITARSLAAPFGTPIGQLVLAVVAGIYAIGLWWMHRLTLINMGGRLLEARPATPEAARGGPALAAPPGSRP